MGAAEMVKVLVTGAAGFIGSFVCKKLLESEDVEVLGVDNLNGYYDVSLKDARLDMLARADGSERFRFEKLDIADQAALVRIFEEFKPSIVINLAAQAGVRYSIENPQAYIDSNLIGFFNVLEACRHFGVDHLIYASSSSVYGDGNPVPYSVEDKTDSPVSLYAATKKSNELMAYAYSKLYGIPATGLRFFTVYGPMGRPDMAYFKFANKIVDGEPIEIYNMGDMERDFTYVDDIVESISRLLHLAPPKDGNGASHHVYNIGNSDPVQLLHFVDVLERLLIEEGVVDAPTEHVLLPMQPGDVHRTFAYTKDLEEAIGYEPRTSIEEGLREFVVWYKEFYGL